MPVLKVKSLRSGRVYIVYGMSGARFLLRKEDGWYFEPIEYYVPVESGPDKKLHKAIRLLEEEYERAKRMDFVHYPIAWALYQVWKVVDKEECNNGSI